MATKKQVINRLVDIGGLTAAEAERVYTKCERARAIVLLVNNPGYVQKQARIKAETIEQARLNFSNQAFGMRSETPEGYRLIEMDEMHAEYAIHWRALQSQREYVQKIADIHRERLLARPDVTGMHVGLMRKDNKIVCPLQFCIRIHVARKLKTCPHDPHALQCHNAYMPTPLERTIDGVRVDILEMVPERILSSPPDPFARAARIKGGLAISPDSSPSSFGTLGVPVLNTATGLEQFLTNAHVADPSGVVTNSFSNSMARAINIQQPPAKSSSASPNPNDFIGQVIDPPILNQFMDVALITKSFADPNRRSSRSIPLLLVFLRSCNQIS